MQLLFKTFLSLTILSFIFSQEQCDSYSDCIKCLNSNSQCKWESLDSRCSKSSSLMMDATWFEYLEECNEDKATQIKKEKYCLRSKNKNGKLFPYSAYINNSTSEQSIDTLFCEWEVSFNQNSKKTVKFFFEEIKPQDYKYTLLFYHKDNTYEEASLEFSDVSGCFSYQKIKKNIIGFKLIFFGINVPISTDIFIFHAEQKEELSIGYIMLILFLVLLLIIFSGCCLYKYKIVEVEETAASKEVINTHNEEAINEIVREIEYKSGNEPMKCTICYEVLEEKGKVTQLLCGHYFHYECLKKWLSKQKKELKCPNCNFILATIKQGFIIVSKENQNKLTLSNSNDVVIHNTKMLTSCPSRGVLIGSECDNNEVAEINENNNNILILSHSS